MYIYIYIYTHTHTHTPTHTHTHTHNGILLRHKKEWNWIICSDEDEPKIHHTEWSKLERGRWYKISYINGYIWNLEKSYQEPICRRRIEMQTQWTCGYGVRRGWDKWREYHRLIYTTCVKWYLVRSCCIEQGTQLGALWWPRGEVGREAQKGGEIYIHTHTHI